VGSDKRRRHPRYRGNVAAWIAWDDNSGKKRHLMGRCVDVSVSGSCIELTSSVRPGTTVTVGIPRLSLTALAAVRHCREAGGKFAVGLEFQKRARLTKKE